MKNLKFYYQCDIMKNMLHIFNILIDLFLQMPEKAVAPHTSTLAWKIPWTEEPGRLQSMGSLRDTTEWLHFHFHFHALEKAMAIHSSVLAWRIPGTREPGGLPSMGSHRVRNDWSDLVTAAATDAYIYLSEMQFWKIISGSIRIGKHYQYSKLISKFWR